MNSLPFTWPQLALGLLAIVCLSYLTGFCHGCWNRVRLKNQLTSWLRYIHTRCEQSAYRPSADVVRISGASVQRLEGDHTAIYYTQWQTHSAICEQLNFMVVVGDKEGELITLFYMNNELVEWRSEDCIFRIQPLNTSQLYLASEILWSVRRITTIPLPKLGQ